MPVVQVGAAQHHSSGRGDGGGVVWHAWVAGSQYSAPLHGSQSSQHRLAAAQVPLPPLDVSQVLAVQSRRWVWSVEPGYA